VLAYFLAVSPGWVETMGVPLKDGRDLNETDVNPRAALVNEAFVRQCFHGQNPIGRTFEKESGDGVTRLRYEVAGVVGDARYRNMREPITPTAYVPFRSLNADGGLQGKASGVFLVRTAGTNPMSLANMLRHEVPRARSEFRVSNIRSQVGLNEQHTIRERMLAMLASFFAAVSLLLAGIGLYGVLEYSVLQRRRELGIRIAIGAQPREIARLVLSSAGLMMLTGVAGGLLAGVFAVRYISTLLYQVKGTESALIVTPALVILTAAMPAVVPAVIRALRINPAEMLRPE
jgi:predicted lysophospholipase L1 biosynthesis ABC-type transport system permease subunit